MLRLGDRITLFATYIAESTKSETGYIPYVNYCTAIYPGRNDATHIVFHHDQQHSFEDKSCRIPPGIDREHDGCHAGLMSLKSFLSSGFDTDEGIILVCVRSVGPRKTMRSRKRETTVDLIEVEVCDDTATAVLKLWGGHVPSAGSFVPNHTILLISHPSCKSTDRYDDKSESLTEVGIGYSSLVHVNPVFAEADWLRKKIIDMTKKVCVLTQIPAGIWNAENPITATTRELFTIAEVDESVRLNLGGDFVGKLNVILLEVNIMDIWRKAMFCCIEW